MPGLDGSSAPYVHELQAAGLLPQSRNRQRFVVDRTIRVGDHLQWIQIEPAERLQIEYRLLYDHPLIGRQKYFGELTPELFVRDLCSARTFLLKSEAEQLALKALALGLGIGTCWYSTSEVPSTTNCDLPTSACGIRRWTSSAIWHWCHTTSSERSQPFVVGTGSTRN